MKKKILFIILSFFLFSPNAFALSKVNRMDVNIKIEEDGTSLITEEWKINSSVNNYYEKNFYDVKDVSITDITLEDSSESNYMYIEKFDKNRNSVYSYKDEKKTKKIMINTNNKDTTLKLSYKVDGLIVKYDDVYAINWNVLSSTNSLEIGTLNVNISGPIEFSETNMALYGIGNNLSCVFEDGNIHLFASNVLSKTKIKIMASITNYEFEKYLNCSGSFQENYEKYKSRTPFHAYIEEVLDNILISILIALAVILIIGFTIYKLVKKDKLSADYKSIKPYNKNKAVNDLQHASYNDSIPCDKNLYKMYFFANYYHVIKHRSSLVGALIFKWILEGIISIENEEAKYYLRLNENVSFDNPLDQTLYGILVASSTNHILDNNKLIRYATSSSKQIIDWYDSVVAYAIKDEYIKRNINVKKNKIILNKVIYDEAERIQGLKKYLLNFNQVPRKSELTEEVYKYTLISSVLLRVDENLYKELLRKNPNNDGALMLEKFSKVKYIYNNIYSISIEEFKKNRKNKRDKNRYNPKESKK